jgi:hypothetical protein
VNVGAKSQFIVHSSQFKKTASGERPEAVLFLKKEKKQIRSKSGAGIWDPAPL